MISKFAPLTDYHSHTTRCQHAIGTMEAYIERARALGLSEFGFSEHSPWMVQPRGFHAAMTREEMPGYVKEVLDLRERYETRDFKVRLGIEMDFVPSRFAEARTAAEAYPWDYLIGSVHHLGFWCLPDPGGRPYFDLVQMEDLCDLYFEQVAYLCRERFCDVLAHIDVVKKMGHRLPDGLLPWIEPLIPALREAEITVEINTSGFDHAAGEPYPGYDVIEALHAGGVGLMLCSDAHAPEHVGRHFAPVLEELRRRGVNKLVRYVLRQRIEYGI